MSLLKTEDQDELALFQQAENEAAPENQREDGQRSGLEPELPVEGEYIVKDDTEWEPEDDEIESEGSESDSEEIETKLTVKDRIFLDDMENEIDYEKKEVPKPHKDEEATKKEMEKEEGKGIEIEKAKEEKANGKEEKEKEKEQEKEEKANKAEEKSSKEQKEEEVETTKTETSLKEEKGEDDENFPLRKRTPKASKDTH